MNNYAISQYAKQTAAELDFDGYLIMQAFQLTLEEANLHKKAAIVGIWLEEHDNPDTITKNSPIGKDLP